MQNKTQDIIALAADPYGGARELARFEAAYESALGRPFDWSPEAAQMLSRIFGNSRVLADRLAANPGWADDIALSPYSVSYKPIEAMKAELDSMIQDACKARDEISFMRAICDFKYAQMTRIVMKDLARAAPVSQLLAEWSDVADAIIDAAWQRSYEMLTERHGEPMTPADGGGHKRCAGVVIALGKLGGRELNLSSDVDIMIIYDSDEGGAISPSGARMSNHEFFVKQTSQFSRLISRVTERGFGFRVDHELRPEGPQGPLANSLDAAERYYEYFGQGWERQALIRARPVAGDMELGRKFLETVRPFVFRKSMSLADLAHMRKMKQAMERQAERSGRTGDIKLGRGGIREVEFLTQALCLLFGGGLESVRTGNTFAAIEALARESIIHPYGARSLADAYSFLRRIENMLQAEGDLQVHRLPLDEHGLNLLARRMGYSDGGGTDHAARLKADLARHREVAAKLFAALFSADYERQELMEAIRDNAGRAANEEEEIDSLAWFRNQETRRIQNLDITKGMPTERVMQRLTLAAEAVLACAWEIASRHLEARYGTPRLEDGGRAGFSVIGLGSLGSREIDYCSDLDLCFIYSGAGSTDGSNPVSNVEYFTKLAQRIISMISLPGRYGRAYQVDSELRPSGRAGTLVATIGSFVEYHKTESQLWERQSLMKARAIAGDEEFTVRLGFSLDELAFRLSPPTADAMKEEITKLRRKTIEERSIRKPGSFELKIGRGGIADLEAIVQMHQMLNARACDRLHAQNTFEIIDALSAEGIVPANICATLSENLLFLRRMVSRLRLVTGRATDVFSPDAPYAEEVAKMMGEESAARLAILTKQHMDDASTLFDSQMEPFKI
ncbi:MAG: hypothetical protein WC683_08840 [bacterium]